MSLSNGSESLQGTTFLRAPEVGGIPLRINLCPNSSIPNDEHTSRAMQQIYHVGLPCPKRSSLRVILFTLVLALTVILFK